MKTAFWAVSMVVVLFAGAAGQNTSEELIRQIIDSARQNRLKIPALAMDVEVTMFKADDNGVWQETALQRMIYQYRQKGELLDLGSTRYRPDQKGGFIDDDFRSRLTWDGQKALSRHGIYGYISQKESVIRDIVFSDNAGSILDGFFNHNWFEGDWTRLFESELRNVSLRPAREAVNNHMCHVLEADTKYGSYTLWVDPVKGFCIRQARISVDAEDLAWGKPLRESYERKGPCVRSEEDDEATKRYYRGLEIAVTDLVIERKAECYFPTAGTYIRRIWCDDGYKRSIKRIIKRRNITFNPDFEAIGAFQMDWPNAITVIDNNNPGVRYQWLGGKLLPYAKKQSD